MTSEEKQLLFKDLVARLPYTPMVNLRGKAGYDRKLVSVHRYTTRNEFEIVVNSDDDEGYMPHNFEIDIVKPYLRPMSSMTDEEWRKMHNCCNAILMGDKRICIEKSKFGSFSELQDAYTTIDWLNAHHFDYRGLIEKGLALEAKKGMYE